MREGRLVTASCTTVWLDWIHRELALRRRSAADARRGRTVDRLSLDLRAGRSRKLLWLSVDQADIPLLAALNAWGIATTSPGGFGPSG
jgi:hypothetical protein